MYTFVFNLRIGLHEILSFTNFAIICKFIIFVGTQGPLENYSTFLCLEKINSHYCICLRLLHKVEVRARMCK